MRKPLPRDSVQRIREPWRTLAALEAWAMVRLGRRSQRDVGAQFGVSERTARQLVRDGERLMAQAERNGGTLKVPLL